MCRWLTYKGPPIYLEDLLYTPKHSLIDQSLNALEALSWGAVRRRSMLKELGESVAALPNHQRHVWAPWDAFVLVADPDALAREFGDRNVLFRQSLGDTDDGLRGFEVADLDGYVCFFGRPR